MDRNFVASIVARKRVLVGAAALATLLVGTRAWTQFQDWPSFQGGNTRAGKNLDPVNTGPGRTLLGWFAPGGRQIVPPDPTVRVTPVFIDNTDRDPALPQNDDPNDPGPYGVNPDGTTTYNTAVWIGPQLDATGQPVNEAGSAYLAPIRRTADGNGNQPNFNTRNPVYSFTRTVPSASFANPTQALAGYTAQSFTWNLLPADARPGNFALSVNLPVGPTTVGGVRLFPQRYFVYEIRYGVGGANRFVDIVDTYAGGSGFVRLGNAGRPTNRVFPFDGTNPIRITLFNTVPRFSNGELTTGRANPAQSAEANATNYAVYADAVRATPVYGEYVASPVSSRLNPADPLTTNVTAANNVYSVAQSGGQSTPIQSGVVTNYDYRTGQIRWRYSPLEESSLPVVRDNSQASVTAGFISDAVVPRFAGTDAATAPIAATVSATATYRTRIAEDESYEIYLYLPGDQPTKQFGRQVRYQVIAQGVTYNYEVDQSLPRGWVRLGDRRFLHTDADPVRVIVQNTSANAGDAARWVYTDAIRFVGESSRTITSTPVHATVGIRQADNSIVQTNVVIVADENGFIHCLNNAPNADGTVTEFWSYPSLRDTRGIDPNLVNGEDYGGPTSVAEQLRSPTADMPRSFDLSSALVQNIGGRDVLIIGSTNGRVYCIDMAGRGDFNSQFRRVGTTRRVWTYPNTYPSPAPVESALGPIQGSISYAEPNGQPTIYVPTTQGRLYALNAVGTPANKSTTVRWAFPQLNQQPMGPIVTTPAVQFGNVYFGTQRLQTPTQDFPGRFLAVNAETGALVWNFERSGTSPEVGLRATDDFLSGPVAVSAADNANLMPDTVYAINQNRIVYAFNAQTGAVQWETEELGVGARGSLAFTWMSVYNNVGTQVPRPVVMVPTLDGKFVGLFATTEVNRNGFKRAFSYTTGADQITSSFAISNGWMYAGDSNGFLYAFNETLGTFGNDVVFPGNEDIVENNPVGDIFRKTKMRFINRDLYRRLRLPTGSAGHPDYATAVNSPGIDRTTFEWGETMYLLVYDFPYLNESVDDPSRKFDPPIVNVSFNVDGKTIRGQAVQSRKFSGDSVPLNSVAPAGPIDPPYSDLQADGYAILAFPLQSGGANSVPPGNGEISISISTPAFSNNFATQQNVLLDPNLGPRTDRGFSRFRFNVANPLGIIVPTTGATNADPATAETSAFGLGLSDDPANAENVINGNPGTDKVRLGTSVGRAAHGQNKKSIVYLVDRSMMGLLRPDGQGLDGVRISRRDLQWQGGAAAVRKAFPADTVGFEDLPVNTPNTSLDYPDIRREQLRATKDPNGNAENPMFNGVTLRAARGPGGAQLDESVGVLDRVFVPTPVELAVEVPRFQPPNDETRLNTATRVTNSAGGVNPQGYMGRLNVFVDSLSNGQLDLGQREAFRAFNLSASVDVDQRVSIATPKIDLGSLAGGTGYSTAGMPGAAYNMTTLPENLFNPWAGAYATVFRPFEVRNEGNVNLLNLRVAKVTDLRGALEAQKIGSPQNDPFTWFDTTLDLWSDMDAIFAPTVNGRIILQKPRPGDVVPTELKTNPVRRANPNLGTTGLVRPAGATRNVDDAMNQRTRLVNGQTSLVFTPDKPKIGVSVPIGFPVGTYREFVRVFEDSSAAQPPVWSNKASGDDTGGGIEAFTEPGFELSFRVGETRLTNSFSARTAPMVDNLLPTDPGTQVPFAFTNREPAGMRDAFGSLVMAFSSNREGWTPGLPNEAQFRTNPFRIYVSTLDSQATFNANAFTTPYGYSPIRDLNVFRPAGASWFRQAAAFPSNEQAGTIFGTNAADLFDVRFGNPAFPSSGMKGAFPVTPSDLMSPSYTYNSVYMAYVGSAQRQTPSGRLGESRLALSVVTPAQDGSITIGNPIPLNQDPLVAKGKPSLIQTPTGAMVFYPGTTSGRTNVYYTRYDAGSNSYTPVSSLPFGRGFANVSAPSVTGRVNDTGTPFPVVSVAFQGQLRGRTAPEIYFGQAAAKGGNGVIDARLGDRLAAEGNDGKLDPAQVWTPLPLQTSEELELTGETGVYRTRGVVWNDPVNSADVRIRRGSAEVSILDTTSRAVDSQTGVISYTTTLGGRVVIDPNVGTVRFTSTVPGKDARILATYQPYFLRISDRGTVGYTEPTLMFDRRYVSDTAYGANAGGGALVYNQAGRYDRWVTTYNRGAVTGGLAARPYLNTLRLGITLRAGRLPTTPNGAVGYFRGNAFVAGIQSIQVLPTGDNLNAVVQVDPATGQIYFPTNLEGALLRIRYYAIDESGALILANPTTPQLFDEVYSVGYVTERPEELIPMETSVNEGGLTSFLDPFTYPSGPNMRPPLVWMFWTSTRRGTADVYMQSIAPQWVPIVVGQESQK